MSGTIVWAADCTGEQQETFSALIAPLLKQLVRARLCAKCRRPDCHCKRRAWTFDAEVIRDRLPKAIVVNGCIGDAPLPDSWLDILPRALEAASESRLTNEGGDHDAHSKEHFDHKPGESPRTHEYACFASPMPTLDDLAHELAHSLTVSHYDEMSGQWRAPHGVHWQRTFAAMGFPDEARAYARMIRAEDRRTHVEWDERYAA